jgi:hypothetical protein
MASTSFFSLEVQAQKAFKIIAPSDPSITTHQLVSGKLTLGITENGGGVINQLILPGLGDIMGEKADMYGRSGQSSIRSMGHRGKYNPTQAGFNERLGTVSPITQTKDELIVHPRGCALWKADGQYDFTQWENIGSDSYRDDNGNSDLDDLDESNLTGKQATEVHSEFDYFGVYQNYIGKHGIKTAAIRHYLEYRFIREPGHCINQFREGTPVWVEAERVKDISVKFPEGEFKGTDKDMNNMNAAWSVRNDLALWNPGFRYIQTNNGKWQIEPRTKVFRGDGRTYKQVFIVADSDNENEGSALGFYKPNSKINQFPIIGVKEADGSVIYKDNRTTQFYINESPTRTSDMSWMGFKDDSRGMINRDRLPEGIYETYHAEYFIFYGTPKEIMTAIDELDKELKKTGKLN